MVCCGPCGPSLPRHKRRHITPQPHFGSVPPRSAARIRSWSALSLSGDSSSTAVTPEQPTKAFETLYLPVARPLSPVSSSVNSADQLLSPWFIVRADHFRRSRGATATDNVTLTFCFQGRPRCRQRRSLILLTHTRKEASSPTLDPRFITAPHLCLEASSISRRVMTLMRVP